MVGEAWANGAVTTVYAKRTLQTTLETLQDESKTLAQDSDIPAAQLTEAQQQIKNLQQTVNAIAAAIEQRDRTSLSAQLQQLSFEEQTLRTLAQNGDVAR